MIQIATLNCYRIPELIDQFPPNARPSYETIRRMIKSGKLPGKKFGREWYIPADKLRDWLTMPERPRRRRARARPQ